MPLKTYLKSYFPKNESRLEYLQLLLNTNAASVEEREEYAALVRADVDAFWEKYWTSFKEEQRERIEREVASASKKAIKLRAVGQFDFAAKTEAYIEVIKSGGYNFNYRGFPYGWGDEFLRSK